MSLSLLKDCLLRFRNYLSLLHWTKALTLHLLLKMSPRKLKPSLKVPLYLNKFTIWTCIDGFITSGLVFLIANWVYWKSYRNEYVGLFVLHLLLLLSWALVLLPVSFHMSHVHLFWIFSVIGWMSRISLLKTGRISATRLESKST